MNDMASQEFQEGHPSLFLCSCNCLTKLSNVWHRLVSVLSADILCSSSNINIIQRTLLGLQEIFNIVFCASDRESLSLEINNLGKTRVHTMFLYDLVTSIINIIMFSCSKILRVM
uniref:Uncharacterized protein n=1 Tax=Cacopsylla melanoneura TaxID=428564 RepID=A0A8D8R9D5_9HEMI